MAAGFETLGWILSIKDLATAPVRKVSTLVSKTVSTTADVVKTAATGMRDGLMSVFGEKDAWEANAKQLDRWSSIMADLGMQKLPAFVDVLKRTGDELHAAFAENDYAKLLSTAVKGIREAQPMLSEMAVTLGKITLSLTGLPALFKTITFAGRTAATATNELLQKFISIETITKGIDAMGGLAGVLLGPLAPLLKLFQPLINMVVEQFTPAMETFSEIVSNAFGPFSMTLEIIARNLATKLVPLIEPFASFLELAAVQVGIFIEGLLKGKPDKVFMGLFQAFMKLQPVAMQLLDILMKVGMDVMDTLIKAAIKLGPLVIETFAKFLTAVLPLIEPLTKLAVTLLEKVFVPLLIKVVEILDTKLIPLIDAWMPTLIEWIDFITERLDNFFSNFDKYWHDFNILFVQPFMEWIGGIIDYLTPLAMEVKTALIDPILSYIDPIIQKIQEVAESVANLLGMGTDAEAAAKQHEGKGLAAAQAEGPSSLVIAAGAQNLTGEARRAAIDEYLAKHGRQGGMAAGGVVKGPISTLVGEAGPEMVLPLKREVVSEVLAPLIPDVTFPALDKLLAVAMQIDKRMGGAVRVLDTGMKPQQQQRQPAPDPFGGSVGLNGVGGW